MRQRLDFQIRWTAFPLHPETPQSGRDLADLFAAHPGYLEAMWPRLQSAADRLGVAFGKRSRTFNSRAACELAKMGRVGRLWLGSSIWRSTRPILKKGPTILPSFRSCGRRPIRCLYDSTRVSQVLQRGEQAAAVDADWERCREQGVSAIPTLVRGGEQMVGFHPLPGLEEFFSRGA